MARKNTYRCDYCGFETGNLYGSYICPRCRHVLKPAFDSSSVFPLKGLIITGAIVAVLWLLFCLVGKANFIKEAPFIIAILAAIEFFVFLVFFFVALGKKVPKKIAVFGMLICLAVFIVACAFANNTNINAVENTSKTDIKKEDSVKPIPSEKPQEETQNGAKEEAVLTPEPTTMPDPTPEPTPEPTPDPREEYINQCTPVEYESVARNPDTYKNTSISFKGKVVQVLDGSTVNYRVVQENSEDIWAADTWLVLYKPAKGESRILEGDTIVVFGRCTGLTTYKAILGQQVTVPCVEMKYYEIVG